SAWCSSTAPGACRTWRCSCRCRPPGCPRRSTMKPSAAWCIIPRRFWQCCPTGRRTSSQSRSFRSPCARSCRATAHPRTPRRRSAAASRRWRCCRRSRRRLWTCASGANVRRGRGRR
ncbi:unnamed protein product, partial [Effrenium voratum]